MRLPLTIALLALVCFCRRADAAIINVAAGDVPALKTALNLANSNGEDDTINLAPGSTYTLTALDNFGNGLPVIRTDNGHSLIINGNGATIMRSEAGGTVDFRILQVGGFANATVNQLTVRNGRVTGSTTGAGVNLDNGTLVMVNCTIRNNSASESQQSGAAVAGGGGLYNEDGVLVLQNCTLTGNSVSAFSGNGSSAIASGGAIYNVDGIVLIQNCTVTGNFCSAASSSSGGFGFPDAAGGAISNIGTSSGYGSVTISNSTFNANSSSNSGGGIPSSNGIENIGPTAVLTFGNTILAGTALSNSNGMIMSNGYNLSNDNGAGFLTATGDQINTNPQLGPLGDYGGLTQTHPLLPGSPAIDRGKRDAVPTLSTNIDQRGLPRPFDFPGINAAAGGDSSDIGAFEVIDPPQAGATLTVTTVADHDDGFCGPTDCTLREAITAANALAGDNTIHFPSALTGIIQLASQLPTLSTNMEIKGPGANRVTVRRNAGGDYRIFTIPNNVTVGLSGLTITNGNLAGAGTLGGGILNDGGTLTVSGCAVTGNRANSGAGLYNAGANGATATLTQCTFEGNIAATEGGAVNNVAIGGTAALFAINSTFSGNSAGNNAGAIGNGGAGGGNAFLTLTNCTFSGNSAPTAGGVNTTATLGGSTASTTVRNTIFKTGASGANLAKSGAGSTVASDGRNRSNDNGGGFLNASGDIVSADPMIGALLDNGGPTLTHALLAGSSAINNANAAFAPPTDQRGYARNGASDIGAFEFDGIIPNLRITAITRLANGHILLQGFGVPNALHTFEFSPGPASGSFTAFPTTVTADANGALQYDDATAVGRSTQFYRLRFP